MRNRSLAVDWTSSAQRVLKFTPKKFYGEICFAERVYNKTIILFVVSLNTVSQHQPAGNRLLIREQEAAHQRFLK